MADQKEIVLRQGDASPKDIVLYDLPAATPSSGTTIYLYQGDATPKDIVLRNPVAEVNPTSKTQSIAITLDDVIVAITQSITVSNSQAIAFTLDDVTASVTQALGHSQTLALTLDGVTVAASQGLSHSQSIAFALDGITIAANQTLSHSQNMAITLDGATSEISQTSGHSQSLGITLDDVTSIVNQISSHEQNVTFTLDDVVVDIRQSVSSAPSHVVINSGGYWNPPNFRFNSRVTKRAEKAIEQVTALGLDDDSAEIALRLRLNRQYKDDYLYLQNLLKESREIEQEITLNRLRQQILINENNRRISIILMLA